ncbi:MAG: hypothetical protein H3C59_01980 [Burkholderiaceae bacterium]|nr:hypothetical protein [Burkholderiaceae bacterium]
MTDASRAATIDDLKTLVVSLNERGVEYLLIGGYALAAHGYHRATVDIDLLVPASRETGHALRQALLVLPDKAARDIDPDWFEEGDNIRVADEIVVDVMFNAAGETFETLQAFAETIELDGVPLRTVNLEGLLRTKQGLREKDVADRRVLEAALRSVRKNEAPGPRNEGGDS